MRYIKQSVTFGDGGDDDGGDDDGGDDDGDGDDDDGGDDVCKSQWEGYPHSLQVGFYSQRV